MRRGVLLVLICCGVGIGFLALSLAQGAKGLEPTHGNVAYGPDERNVVDFYQAKSDAPTPLAIFIHGGGFRGGSKEKLNAGVVRALLEAGISVASVNYRMIPKNPLPMAHEDCRRALQFLRSKSKEWKIDKTRVAAFGGSAGAQLSMWLGFHDEMARPASSDPVERESTRLTCVAATGGQASMDLAWWEKWIPGVKNYSRDQSESYGNRPQAEIDVILKDISVINLISSDDPPTWMSYRMPPDETPPSKMAEARGWIIHHVTHGQKLKETLDGAGVENYLMYPGETPRYGSVPEFLKAKLVGE